MVKIKYWIILGTCKVIGALPAWFLYHVFLDFVYFVVYRVVGYRVKIVRNNLATSFPEKTQQDLRAIEREFYHHLAEIFVDTIDLSGISRRQMRKRTTYINLDQHRAECEGRSWISAMAHYGCWEYSPGFQLFTESQVAGVYKTLHDKAFDMFYIHCRSRFGADQVTRKGVLRYIINRMRPDSRPFCLGLIADQYSRGSEESIWFDFLNHKTLFFSGIEKLSRKFHLPVYYMDIRKLGRARYEAEFGMIYDGTEELPHGEITRRYVEELEKTIRRDPPYWMWSHKRWKYKYPEQIGDNSNTPAEDQVNS